jgi:hypothetical protein
MVRALALLEGSAHQDIWQPKCQVREQHHVDQEGDDAHVEPEPAMQNPTAEQPATAMRVMRVTLASLPQLSVSQSSAAESGARGTEAGQSSQTGTATRTGARQSPVYFVPL